MNLPFNEYQQLALSTAVYPRQYIMMAGKEIKPGNPACIYPIFGLLGELGEVGQVLRDNIGDATDLCYECGDVLWYIAAICSDLNIPMNEVAICDNIDEFKIWPISGGDSNDIIVSAFIAAANISELIKKSIRDCDGIVSNDNIKTIKLLLRRILISITQLLDKYGLNIKAAAQWNLDKLSKRSAKNTIHGSGDKR